MITYTPEQKLELVKKLGEHPELKQILKDIGITEADSHTTWVLFQAFNFYMGKEADISKDNITEATHQAAGKGVMHFLEEGGARSHVELLFRVMARTKIGKAENRKYLDFDKKNRRYTKKEIDEKTKKICDDLKM